MFGIQVRRIESSVSRAEKKSMPTDGRRNWYTKSEKRDRGGSKLRSQS
jgi:hypothetical protein